jgi:hypothetical protein
MQGLKWRAIKREDDILEFKAKKEDSQVFIKVHDILEGPILTCARGIQLDGENEAKFYIVNMATQGKCKSTSVKLSTVVAYQHASISASSLENLQPFVKTLR